MGGASAFHALARPSCVARVALAHFTYFLSLARARARGLGDWTRPTARNWPSQGSLPPRPCGVVEAYSTPGGRRPADGALSRPDMAEGGLGGAAIAQGVEIALSGHDRADAAGDGPVLTPGIGPAGRPAGRRRPGTIRRFGGFLRFLAGRGSVGGNQGLNERPLYLFCGTGGRPGRQFCQMPRSREV